MFKNYKNALERWGGVHTVIDHLLEQRRALLVAFIELQDACDDDLTEVSKACIDRFSEHLMDYISSGHFKVYPQLAQEAKAFNDAPAVGLAGKLFERLDMSTELTLAFDEDFSTPIRCEQNMARLPAWLDRLAKGLTERFALEDQLVSRLHADNSPRHTAPGTA